jgi:hypothetical protein
MLTFQKSHRVVKKIRRAARQATAMTLLSPRGPSQNIPAPSRHLRDAQVTRSNQVPQFELPI